MDISTPNNHKRISITELRGHVLENKALPDAELERGVRSVIDEYRDRIESDLLTDPVMDIPSRRLYEKIIEAEVGRRGRSQKPLSLVIIDLDDFKKINDEYGHPIGDAILKKVAQTIQNNIRKNFDTVARYGGEELVVVLPEANLTKAREVAEKLRRAVEGAKLKTKDKKILSVTISCGVAEWGQEMKPEGEKKKIIKVADLQEAADAALYQAKHSGKNCVRSYETGMKMPTEIEKLQRKIEQMRVTLKGVKKELEVKGRIYEHLAGAKDPDAVAWIKNELIDLKASEAKLDQEIKTGEERLEKLGFKKAA